MRTSLRNLLVAGVGTALALAVAIPLLPADATTSTTNQLSAQMDGAQEVPPADPNGVGDAFVFVPADDLMALCYVLVVDRIGKPLAAHIHRAQAGVNGDIVVPLKAPADGDSAGCVQTRFAERIVNNPTNFYVNVHNERFPGGAVRGQLATN